VSQDKGTERAGGSTGQGPTEPLATPTGYDMKTALMCTYLVDVASSMCIDWMQAGSPPGWSEWSPNNLCSVSVGISSPDSFEFSPLIWSTFEWKSAQQVEPYGFVASQGGVAYLVFRGSQTKADFGMDAEEALVAYTPPTSNPPGGLQTEQGFTAVYDGLALSAPSPDLYSQLIITGHSLGSATATLAVPAMLAAGWSPANIVNYPQASPMVGNPAFVDYYNNLGVPTFRLVNAYDIVPTLPGAAKGYAHVGVAATFGADYGSTILGKFVRSVPDNHDPCCSYAYALLNPDAPFNQDMGSCMDWHPSP
jgi:hypothetical protein